MVNCLTTHAFLSANTGFYGKYFGHPQSCQKWTLVSHSLNNYCSNHWIHSVLLGHPMAEDNLRYNRYEYNFYIKWMLASHRIIESLGSVLFQKPLECYVT